MGLSARTYIEAPEWPSMSDTISHKTHAATEPSSVEHGHIHEDSIFHADSIREQIIIVSVIHTSESRFYFVLDAAVMLTEFYEWQCLSFIKGFVNSLLL